MNEYNPLNPIILILLDLLYSISDSHMRWNVSNSKQLKYQS